MSTPRQVVNCTPENEYDRQAIAPVGSRAILLWRPELVVSLLIFAASASLYILLRTQQYLVEDAIRCLSVYWLGRPTTSSNNHLLCLVNVFAWTKMLSLAGVHPANAFDFMRNTHWMTALAAAACVSMFWLVCYRVTRSMGIALAAACAYGFSNAFLLHATSTAEPITGLFWSFASILMVGSGLTVSSRLRLFAGGALLLLAMANYESMVLIGPAELVLIYYWDGRRTNHNRAFALWFLAGSILGGIAIYVPTYALSGTTNPLAMWRRFVEVRGEQVFGGLAASKLVNLPMGFANTLLPSLPIDYSGIRGLLRTHSHDRWIILTPATVFLLLGWIVWTLRRFISVWAELEQKQRLILTCCAVTLALNLLPLIYWEPIYDKIWLQPLSVIFFAWSVIFAAWYRLHPRRLMLVPETLLLVAILTTGLAKAFAASRTPTPCLSAARQLSETFRPSDLVVGGWDPVSLLYSAFWGNGAKRFDLPGIATENGPATLTLLDAEMSRVISSGGRVYLLGVIDIPEETWKPFLEDRCHLPYRSIADLRRCAKPVETLTCSKGDEVLWQISPGCYNSK